MISESIEMYIFICLFISSLVQFRAVYTFSTGRLCHVDEFISLLQFKNGMLDFNNSLASVYCDGLGEYSYPKMKSWNKTSSSDCCTWDGVKCHEITGHIIGLDLSCSRLRGFIHHNSSLFDLSHLQKLNLARNDFLFSNLSPNIGKLSRLSYLNLSASLFKGTIPSDLSHLSKLVLLDLSFNFFLNFTLGNFHILLQNLSNIRVLCLDDLNILSNLPANWTPSLTYLDLGHAGLYGKLPESIFHLTQLRVLLVNGNKKLWASIPKRNPTCTNTNSSLQVLDLSDTNFDADGFNDDSLLFFPLLESLSLSQCEITGSFPISIANLTQMVELDLSLNHFTGDFSSLVPNLPTKLDELNLNWNSFTGQLPSDIGNLTHLRLKCNFLKGTLPFTLSVFPKLRSLELASNAFNGEIPFWLFSCPSITHLDLSRNFLTGQILEFRAKSLIIIDLSSNNLNGFIDFTVFKNLSKLETLKLSHNKLSFKFEHKSNLSFPDLLFLGLSSCEITEFPLFLLNAKNLISLDLSKNKLIGQIPFIISRYSLHHLNLSHNSLSDLGFLNSPFSTSSLNTPPLVKNLEVLDLSSNMFHQELLPLSICSFKSLTILDLSHNNFVGSIPECYGGWNSVLRMLNLENNYLDGIISMKFPKTNNRLMNLNLNGNSLQGTLPGSLRNCKNLKVLNVGNNRIKDAFPNLENLTNLQVLILKSNKFFGRISNIKKEFFFPKLQVFDLSCNDFNGLLPVELLKSFKAMTISDKIVAIASPLGLYRDESVLYRFPISFTIKGGVYQFNGILTTLVAIDLSTNHFVGEIPKIIGNLNNLRVLNLSHNKFSGPIPLSLGKLHCLESLDLSSNLFGGMIPWQLADNTFLEMLNLSQNRLVGRIPQGKQFNTFLNASYSGNLGLCGFPLAIKCMENNLSLHSSHSSSYQDDKDSCFRCEITWKELLIGYVFGILFGCFMFLTGKPKWLVRSMEEVCWYGLLLLDMRKNSC